MKKQKPRYYTYAHNVEDALRNGSFCRVYADGRIAQYMNGDYLGDINKIPASMKEVPEDLALELLPKCCK